MGCFSFYPGKNLGAYGDGGAVTSNDGDLLARVRKLRDHGRTSKYEHDEIGYGERLDALQAAVLGAKLVHLTDWTDARRRHARRYSELLAGSGVTTPTEDPLDEHVFHLYVLRSERRDELVAHLVKAGVGAGIHYPVPLHRQAAYRHLEPVSLPHTELAASQVLSLPMFPEITDEQIEYVADQVRRFAG
jgi:dTDP-4-amino-4,6-dideoxygalactose transaminase